MSEFIPMAIPSVGEEEALAVYEQIKSGWISMGERVREFENDVAEYIGAKHAIAMNNGTATLHAALLALGVKSGDEVIVPALSYISSANAVLYCGATPVFVQENPKTYNVEADAIEALITEKTSVIMTVDLKGMPVDYDEIQALSEKTGIPVLADSAESFGAEYKNKKVGSQVAAHSFSFFANKNMTTGEGGVVTTDDERIADICRCVRNQGQSERYVHVMVGHNYRMTDISAAFGVQQMRKVDQILAEKARIAQFYSDSFASNTLISAPFLPEYVTKHSWYMYCVDLDESVDRDKVIRLMREAGVDSRLSFPLIPLQPVYREMFNYRDGDFPVSEKIFHHFLDIPCWPGMTDMQKQKVKDVVIAAVEESVIDSVP